MLSEKQIKKFQEIWRERGREISAEEADKEGGRLVRLVRLICEPTTASKTIKATDGNLNKESGGCFQNNGTLGQKNKI
jgi:hypothetical protein